MENTKPFRLGWRMVLIWGVLLLLVLVGFLLDFDKKLIALSILLIGSITHAFAGLLALLGLIPWVGPLLVKVITGPFIWLMNTIATFLAFLFLKKGHKVPTTEIVRFRFMVYSFLFGLLIGVLVGTLL